MNFSITVEPVFLSWKLCSVSFGLAVKCRNQQYFYCSIYINLNLG